jgi:hypothetical protein
MTSDLLPSPVALNFVELTATSGCRCGQKKAAPAQGASSVTTKLGVAWLHGTGSARLEWMLGFSPALDKFTKLTYELGVRNAADAMMVHVSVFSRPRIQ